MKVKSLDKNIRDFSRISAFLSILFLLLIFVFGYIYRYFTLDTYNYILLFVIMLLIIITVALILSEMAVFLVYKRKHAGAFLFRPARAGLKLLLPFTIFISGLFKGSKDTLRRVYVEVNNILVLSRSRKYYPREVLMLLPHCLQNSGCGYKITGDITNCRRCGRCSIGRIAEIAEKMKVEAAVVTGGTAARNIVAVRNPGIVLSVACERDLAAGIADVGSTPVLGVLNERPNGPCNNTAVNVQQLKEKLESILINDD
jgi:hypothetical protein